MAAEPLTPEMRSGNGWHHAPLVRAAALVLLALLAYIPAMRAGIIFDDAGYLFNSRFVRSSTGLYDYWFTTEPMAYYPVTHTTWWLEWRVWGDSPTGYHVVNILLHALGVVVVWRLLRRLRIPAAFVAAAVFAVHPVAVESVAWIAERKNVLSMVFFAASLVLYVRFEDERRRRWYALALLMFLLALLSKASVVTMPFVLLILAWWRRGRIDRRDVLRAVPFFLLALTLGLVTVYFEHHQVVGARDVRPEGLWSRLAASGWCVWFYLYKDVWPLRLSLIYPRFEVDPSQPTAWLPLVGLFVVAALAWRWRRSWGRHVLAALGYFVVMLVPVLGVFDIHFFEYSLVADHFQHLSMLAPIVLVVGTAAALARRWGWAWPGARLAACALIAVLAVLTWRQAGAYQDDYTIWTDTIAKNPNAWLAHKNLGVVLMDRGDFDGAIASYRQALEINPDDEQGHHDLALALATAGQPDEAIKRLHEALRLDDHYAAAHASLGLLYDQRGRGDEALAQYERALVLDPQDVGTLNNLAELLVRLGRVPEALTHYDAALGIRPDYAEARYNRARARRALGRLDDAIDDLRQALAVNPQLVDAWNEWGLILAAQGNARAAAEKYLEALKTKPDYPNAHVNLGYLLLDNRQLDVALMHFRESLALRPDWPQVHNGVARILAGHPDDSVRDPDKALVHAQKAVELTQHKNPAYLDTLAVAYAAAGRFDQAVQTAGTAIDRAEAAGRGPLATELRARLGLYERGEPYRLPTP